MSTRIVSRSEPIAVTIRNDLIHDSTSNVVDAVRSALNGGAKRLALDLSQVGMIDSSGLRALLQALRICEQNGACLELRSASRCVERVILMSGFGPKFGIKATAEAPITRINTKVDLANLKWHVREFVATSDASVIALLRAKVAEAASEAGADEDSYCDILIAAGEALTNAYKHGTPNPGANKITLRCMTCQKAVVVEITDEGEPFDPDAARRPDPIRMREHGMGIYLMRQAMDVVEFDRDNGNRVRMIKWLTDTHNGTTIPVTLTSHHNSPQDQPKLAI